ncbi:MAG: tetratricopeptide repeat protein [Saprospiraceae bacterium]|nr:tetratricopeptide repeat protein [Saprospiraceae bacterium]
MKFFIQILSFCTCLSLFVGTSFAQNPNDLQMLEKCLDTISNDSIQIQILSQMVQANLQFDKKQAGLLKDSVYNIAKRKQLNFGIIRAHNLSSQIYHAEGKYQAALKSASQAAQLAAQQNDTLALAHSYINLGNAYIQKGYMDRAIDYLTKALRIVETQERALDIAICYHAMGLAHFYLKQYDIALEYYNRAIETFKQKNDPIRLGESYVNKGRIFLYNNDTEIAMQLFNKAKILHKKHDFQAGIGDVNRALGAMELRQDNYEQAKNYYEQASDIFYNLGNRLQHGRSLQGLGETALAAENYTEAKLHFKKALMISKLARARVLTRDIYSDLYRMYSAQKEYKDALNQYRKYITVRDTILNQERAERIAEVTKQYKNEKLAREKSELDRQNKEQAYVLDLQDKELELSDQKLELSQLRNNRMLTISIVIGFVFILVIIIISLFFRQKQLQSKVRENELEQRALRSQMNPHFMFNSLNSIQSLIAMNDNASASIYLAKFSKLMRSILQNSRKSFLSIQEESRFLSTYVDLEKRRFKGSFTFNIDVDEVADTNFTMIPTFVIQPFVENAIVHGLLKSPREGKLNIVFTEPEQWENYILCVIEDNGIGREQAKLNNKNRTKTHESLGVKITEQRLNYLSGKSLPSKPLIDFVDLKDKEGKALGTRVELLLPMRYATLDKE